MHLRYITLLVGVLIAIAMFAGLHHAGATREQCWTASVTALCACWWLFESLPLSATSLVPLVAFPITGVLTERQAAGAYGDPIVLLFMGGFMLSKAAECWGAHRKIAEATIRCIGGHSGHRLALAIMVATAFISMWISNIATTLMMLPVAMAIIDRDRTGRLAVPLLLGVAYAASIGGIATPIGTAPNGIFMANYVAATGHPIPFYRWIAFGLPLALCVLLVAWAILTFRMGKVGGLEDYAHEPWTTPQRRTLVICGLACLAWFTREIPFGGWSAWLQAWLDTPQRTTGDMTVAMAATLALFLIPAGNGEPRRHLLDWPTAASIPWGILILFGGGIAIANAFEASKLSELVGQQVQGLSSLPPLAILIVICISVTFLSEVTSNTATATVLMPLLAAIAKSNGMDPAFLMIPATFANNLAFMMPVGTPPNAVVYGTGHVRIGHMVRVGFVLNLASSSIVTLFCWKLLP
ncbi:MAG: SLC13/DASS family transporter, partial [Pirellulales bacterium]|nr:SLC13/DASS family transporter [Pirellulales bacterium]